MSWKRSKDGGLDYDVSTELKYREVKRKLFDAYDDKFDARPKASWLVVSPEIANEIEPLMKNQRLEIIRKRRATSNDDIENKLSIKERLKQRIKEGSLRT